MATFPTNKPAATETVDHCGGAILLVKIGTHPKLSNIIPQLQQLLPHTKFFGIGTSDAPVFDNFELVAHEDELLLGAFDDWWQRQLFVEPDLYLKVLPHESRLLRMTQRVVDHDQFALRSPSFPTGDDFGSFEGRRQLLLRQFAFWDFVLRHHKISAVVTQNLPHNFWDAVLHVVAEARGVPYLCFHEVRPFLGSLYVYRHPSEMGNLDFGRSLIESTRQKIGLIGNSPSRRDGMLKQVGLESLQRTREVGNTRKLSLQARLQALSSNRTYVIPRIGRSINRRIRLRKSRKETNRMFWVDEIPEKYFLIELQPPNNATSLTKGFMYGDARELVAHIAHNLPIGYSLVVKESSREHMQSIPRRESFWRQVAALPSVVIIPPVIKTDLLLNDSAGLIEVGYSTLVLQALHSGTPAIIIGQSHLPSLPGLHRVSAQDDLGGILQGIAESTLNERNSSQDLMKSLTDWCDETENATLEGALSSFPKDPVDDEFYQARVVSNLAGVIATWYSQSAEADRSGEEEAVD